MCSNYKAPNPANLPEISQTKIPLRFDPYPEEQWPGYGGPFLASFDASEWMVGAFGLIPHWADPKLARSTYNARSETAATKPSFRNAWKERQLAVIPAACIYEPNYESGKPVRWRIERADGKPMLIAGLWERRLNDPGVSRWSFTMLTVNADGHPLMQRFHKPTDEKRSVVVLDDDEVDGWLKARTDGDMTYFMRLFDPELMVSSAAPLPPRAKKAPHPDA